MAYTLDTLLAILTIHNLHLQLECSEKWSHSIAVGYYSIELHHFQGHETYQQRR